MAGNKRPMLTKIGDTTFDKIQAFYVNPDKYELSETNEKIRKRWIMVVTLMLKAYPKFKIANMLERDFGMSQAQAYIDIKNAENIFGDIYKTSKDVEKLMWKEWVLDFKKRARKNGDLKAESKALDLYAKYGDFEQDDLIFNPEKLQKTEIQIKLPKKLEKFLENYITSGVADFNSLNVTDIEFEDLTDAKGN